MPNLRIDVLGLKSKDSAIKDLTSHLRDSLLHIAKDLNRLSGTVRIHGVDPSLVVRAVLQILASLH